MQSGRSQFCTDITGRFFWDPVIVETQPEIRFFM